jgi:hypothetical protein
VYVILAMIVGVVVVAGVVIVYVVVVAFVGVVGVNVAYCCFCCEPTMSSWCKRRCASKGFI